MAAGFAVTFSDGTSFSETDEGKAHGYVTHQAFCFIAGDKKSSAYKSLSQDSNRVIHTDIATGWCTVFINANNLSANIARKYSAPKRWTDENDDTYYAPAVDEQMSVTSNAGSNSEKQVQWKLEAGGFIWIQQTV